MSLLKIAQDLRLLSSGPRCGIGEIDLPPLQPGSSIMPGKVNPVVLEAAIQVAAQVIGNDAAVTLGGALGVLELNVMLPVMARNLLESVGAPFLGLVHAGDRCVAGIEANGARCEELIEQSLSIITPLSVKIGYTRRRSLPTRRTTAGRPSGRLLVEKGELSSGRDRADPRPAEDDLKRWIRSPTA